MKCRHCGSTLSLSLVDLGSAPPSNANLTNDSLLLPETWLPLRVLVCDNCWLVQTQDYNTDHEFFDSDYSYFSGYSNSWLTHAQGYVQHITSLLDLDSSSLVYEVAANDGSLLQYVKNKNIPCIGIEPTASTAHSARLKGLNVIQEFFGVRLARQLALSGKSADLMIANNVLAHVPDINDFVKGFSILLKPNGVVTFEFPHFVELVQHCQFDTIYHEHYSYLSLTSVQTILTANDLSIFHVEQLPTHGGSLRVYAQPISTGARQVQQSVSTILDLESSFGITSIDYYSGFQARTDKVKDDLVRFLYNAKSSSKLVVGYGAAAKGNTLLNYAGVRPDLIRYVVDNNPAKQGKFLPGSRIPIVPESKLLADKPDYILILPWNLTPELQVQLSYAREWGALFVTAVPTLSIF